MIIYFAKHRTNVKPGTALTARVLPDGPDFMLNNKTIALADGSYLAPIAIRTGPRRLNPYHEGFTKAGALNAVMESLPGRVQRSPLALHVSYNGGDDFSRIVILDPGVGMYPDAELDPDGRTLHILYEDRIDVFYAALDLNAVL